MHRTEGEKIKGKILLIRHNTTQGTEGKFYSFFEIDPQPTDASGILSFSFNVYGLKSLEEKLERDSSMEEGENDLLTITTHLFESPAFPQTFLDHEATTVCKQHSTVYIQMSYVSALTVKCGNITRLSHESVSNMSDCHTSAFRIVILAPCKHCYVVHVYHLSVNLRHFQTRINVSFNDKER